ncbi:hypothetical protein [Rhodopirellula sp. MGV]|uniref:hypothetical protein n=1 Tax=Rhodopirellula sp. MGV TaxID=2023130 RepID=UPI000B963F0E|nr:hypothetical protein [Rhodopirellula sp. MGV]OYP33786.1 hypothetical protein CGZ80_17730 [Rhodopirellula sp. MGV]PNY37548.1 hypothetical protein C2E31_07410 [Rhodopirellula baltica]
MPLRKLWNSIRGKSETEPSSDVQQEVQAELRIAVETTPPVTAKLKSIPPQQSPTPVAVTDKAVLAQSSVADATVAKAEIPRPKLNRADKQLCKQLADSSANTVLEIGIGDGNRGRGIVDALTGREQSTPVCYIAVDSFELGGNPLTLREFHRQLREYPAKVHLVPMPVEQGLDRVLRTYGQVDVILWSVDSVPSDSEKSLLSRLSKPDTKLMKCDDGCWSVLSATSESTIRKAA